MMESKSINEVERDILRKIFSANGKIDSFALFKKLKINFGDFLKSFNTLKEKGFIEEEEYVIRLTHKAKGLVLEKYMRQKPWREVPGQMKTNQLEPDDLYIPRKSLLDKKTFGF